MTQATCSIEGCDYPVETRHLGWCAMHRARWRAHGDPTKVLQTQVRISERRAFLQAAAVATTDDCILMERGANPRPVVMFNRRNMTAARAVWMIANGDPGELHVLHLCNGGSGAHGCINIRHLYLGTHADNMRDRDRNRRLRAT